MYQIIKRNHFIILSVLTVSAIGLLIYGLLTSTWFKEVDKDVSIQSEPIKIEKTADQEINPKHKISALNPDQNYILSANLGNITISIRKGSALDVPSDYIVNSASCEPTLVDSWQGIAGEIRELCYKDPSGKKVLNDDWNGFSDRKPGSVTLVKQNNIPYQFKASDDKKFYLIHSSSPKNDTKKFKKFKKNQLFSAYFDIFENIIDHKKSNNDNSLKTVSLAPLGIGFHKVAGDESATQFFNSLDGLFESEHKFDIVISMYRMDDAHKAFQDKLNSLIGALINRRNKAKAR